ncbi:MAG TPA: carbon-nitrogen hydrolase family protein [Methylomirabilota bacterium]|nr:carbon-nitrogen hydrolase family protein [Methylomirabilota bacterium]
MRIPAARLAGLFMALLFALSAPAAEFRAENFPDSNWRTWAPREEISPKFDVVPSGGRRGASALRIQMKNESEHGGWVTEVRSIAPGEMHKFSAWYAASNIQHDARSVIAKIEWLNEKGELVRAPDFAISGQGDGQWRQVSLTTPAPKQAVAARLQLAIGFAKDATVVWDDISFGLARDVSKRVVRAGTIFLRPRGTKSAGESVEKFCKLAEAESNARLDILCLPEGITVIGNGKSYAAVSESVPGPTTERLGKLARQLRSYVVAGLYEREGAVIYNTAVLLGRDGKLVGKYRKTHLPREEWEAGLSPGNEYPVFETDFGKIGLMICWDVQFPEPARAMALKGAEALFLPIWGGSEVLARARAIENHVFLVSSSYDMKTFIVAPDGKVLAEASSEQPLATAELRLDEHIFQPWLGDMKNRTWKERRPDIAVETRSR